MEAKQSSPHFLQSVLPIVMPSPTHAQAFQASKVAKGSTPVLTDCRLQALPLSPCSPFFPAPLACTPCQREVGAASCLTLWLVLLLSFITHILQVMPSVYSPHTPGPLSPICCLLLMRHLVHPIYFSKFGAPPL